MAKMREQEVTDWWAWHQLREEDELAASKES